MSSSLFTLAFIEGLGGGEMILIFFVILLLFGGKRLPELARGLGKSVREFKKATSGVEDQIKRVMEDEPEAPQPPAPRKRVYTAPAVIEPLTTTDFPGTPPPPPITPIPAPGEETPSPADKASE